MKTKSKLSLLVILIITMCFSCGKQTEDILKTNEVNVNEEPNNLEDTDDTVQDSRDDTITSEKNELPEDLKELSKIELKNLTVQNSTEQIIQNSNLFNLGYLCNYEDKIIFWQESDNAIYVADRDGGNQEKIYDGSANYICIEDDALYFNADGYVKKINMSTYEISAKDSILGGELFSLNGHIYMNTEEGYYAVGETADNLNKIYESNMESTRITSNGDIILCSHIHDTDITYYMKGYLLAYDTKSGDISLAGTGILTPLISEHYIIYNNAEDYNIHALNLDSGMDVIIPEASHCNVATYRDSIYFSKIKENELEIYQWCGESSEKIAAIDTTDKILSNTFIYVSDQYLYFMLDYTSANEWYYYNMETGVYGLM